MAENINCNEKYIEKCDKPKKPTQDEVRAANGQHQTVSDWMKRGGKRPSIQV